MVPRPGACHIKVISDQSRQLSTRMPTMRCLASVHPFFEQGILVTRINAVFEDVFCPHSLPSNSSPTGEESKTSLRESCQYTRREAFEVLLKMSVTRGDLARSLCCLG
jgi:hypothetical protein